FEEPALGLLLLELLARPEPVVDAVHLTGPGRPRGGGNAQPQRQAGGVQQPPDHRGLAGPARAGQDEEGSPGHSTFCTSSRIFSSVPLISTTCREISTSPALEPIVFASRNISWVRNSSLRPGLSGSFMISWNWSRWLARRTTSSAMSLRSAKIATSLIRSLRSICTSS